VPIIVAADTLKAGDTLTYDVISQRPVPEQFVPTSWVLPDHANEIVGKKLVGPAQAGDPISMFLFGVGVLPEACAKAGAAHAR
jgi:pilus assembly protein CpaB